MDDMDFISMSQNIAIQAWENYLNNIRINRMLDSLIEVDLDEKIIKAEEGQNLKEANKLINESLEKINNEIVENGGGRGGEKGMHGFIAEILECGIENARSVVEGKEEICEYINDNKESDLRRNGEQLIQLKFVKNHLSLQAILNHKEKYPNYVKDGATYQIPKDHYDRIEYLLSISEEDANKMATSSGDFSLSEWEYVRGIFKEGKIDKEKIEPSLLTYDSVQRNTYIKTGKDEKKNLKKISKKRIKDRKKEERIEERRQKAFDEGKPGLKDGGKTVVGASVIGGFVSLLGEILKKLKNGKSIAEISEKEWIEIIDETGIGIVKGGVDGACVYLIDNYVAESQEISQEMCEAYFELSNLMYLFGKGEISETIFYLNTEKACLECTMKVLSLFIQGAIPIPVLGTIIGCAVGKTVEILIEELDQHHQDMLKRYFEEIAKLEKQLDKEYEEFLIGLKSNIQKFMEILNNAFVPDVRRAFSGSIELALEVGVDREEILDSKEKVYSYFLE